MLFWGNIKRVNLGFPWGLPFPVIPFHHIGGLAQSSAGCPWWSQVRMIQWARPGACSSVCPVLYTQWIHIRPLCIWSPVWPGTAALLAVRRLLPPAWTWLFGRRSNKLKANLDHVTEVAREKSVTHKGNLSSRLSERLYPCWPKLDDLGAWVTILLNELSSVFIHNCDWLISVS